MVLGSRMAALVARIAPHVPLHVVPNWSPTADIAPLRRAENPLNSQWHMNDRFIVGYSGNLGRAHELGIVLDAAERLRYRLEIVFLIIGEGNQRDNLQAKVMRRGLANVVTNFQRVIDPQHFLHRQQTFRVSARRPGCWMVFASRYRSAQYWKCCMRLESHKTWRRRETYLRVCAACGLR